MIDGRLPVVRQTLVHLIRDRIGQIHPESKSRVDRRLKAKARIGRNRLHRHSARRNLKHRRQGTVQFLGGQGCGIDRAPGRLNVAHFRKEGGLRTEKHDPERSSAQQAMPERAGTGALMETLQKLGDSSEFVHPDS